MSKDKNKLVKEEKKLPTNKILESSKLKKPENLPQIQGIKVVGGTNYIATKKAVFNGGTNIINVSINGRTASGVFTPKLLTDKNKPDLTTGLTKQDKAGALTAEVVKEVKGISKTNKLATTALKNINKRTALIGTSVLLGVGALLLLSSKLKSFFKDFKLPSLGGIKDAIKAPLEKVKDIAPVKKILDTRKDVINKSTNAEKEALAKVNSNVYNDVGGFNNKALGKMMQMSDAKINRAETIDVGGKFKGNVLVDSNKINSYADNGRISKDLAKQMSNKSNAERVTPSIKKFNSTSAKGTVLKFPVTIKIKEDKPTADKLYHILTIERIDKDNLNPLHKQPRLIITGVTKVLMAKNIKIPPNTPFCIVDAGFEIGGDISAFMQGSDMGFESYINNKTPEQDAKNLDAVRTKEARDKYNKQYKKDTDKQIYKQVISGQVKNAMPNPVKYAVKSVKDIPAAYDIGKRWVGEKTNELKDLWNKNETILNDKFNEPKKVKQSTVQNQNITNGNTTKISTPSNQGGTTVYGPYTADLQYMSAEQNTIGR
jgi:hypothetical protein